MAVDDGGPDERIGILGGTFDPVHVGHLVAAQAVHEALALDRILLIPSGVPPHKGGTAEAPAALRFRMTRAAVEEDPRFQVLDLELRREGPSFTADTLRQIRETHPSWALFLLMGADQWSEFGGWSRPWEILRIAMPVVMARSGEDPRALDPGLPPPPEDPPSSEPLTVEVPRVDLSSTLIRDRIREGRSVRYMVPESVHRILEASKLYS
jgi:nicotinate-nucleotide adenylyltransferase